MCGTWRWRILTKQSESACSPHRMQRLPEARTRCSLTPAPGFVHQVVGSVKVLLVLL